MGYYLKQELKEIIIRSLLLLMRAGLGFLMPGQMKKVFRRTNRMRTIGTRFLGDGADSFNPLPVLESFDGLVFYNKTSAAQGF